MFQAQENTGSHAFRVCECKALTPSTFTAAWQEGDWWGKMWNSGV
eukprot:CAMPEP_0172085668 /NCGR_PEP_ID=MMETSP1043-20130122/21680_1 /TAXON_ID=464988 /ORGANISM="Hemiselmis andersenii, Strain CCMP441" /LENGTH=44 /DNA_ID= /DNA_START= /DNA_END= /DNA_ORIENTATION=